ncbi:MAG: hypothetical protein KF789_08395 [Bdellovibrionaceae bacterium]|nr:hypothetical protein [Pseudobdellovibrionaceae bacterium]
MQRLMGRNRFEVDPADLIHFRTLKRIEKIGSDHSKIEFRMRQLETEWPIEKVLQAKAAAAVVFGTYMGLRRRNRAWFALPLIASGLLLQHTLMENSPDFRLLRRWGFRTQQEIDEERSILKGLRGDFSRINELAVSKVMEAAQH